MGKLQLSVRCKECGTEFDTGLRLDRRSFERGTLAANYHRCPSCGVRSTYRKNDYMISDDGAAHSGSGSSHPSTR